jgi:hypothetical protein
MGFGGRFFSLEALNRRSADFMLGRVCDVGVFQQVGDASEETCRLSARHHPPVEVKHEVEAHACNDLTFPHHRSLLYITKGYA